MVFSFVLIVGIVNLTSISANATNTIIINEYEELRQRNYNDDQIEAIKTYDGTEEISIKAVATIKFTVKKNIFSYNSKTGVSASITLTHQSYFTPYSRKTGDVETFS